MSLHQPSGDIGKAPVNNVWCKDKHRHPHIILEIPDAGDSRSGILFAIYRHIDKRIKMGVGYNFTDFSDDLTDLDYDSQGVFINLIGKF